MSTLDAAARDIFATIDFHDLDAVAVMLVTLAKLRQRVEHDYRELKQCLGLDHYEGRTYRGLHHHLTSVTVAHAFLTCCRLHQDPGRPQLAAA